MVTRGGVLEGVRKPAYTGENRCVPCTLLNVGLAVVVADVLTYLAHPLGAAPAVVVGISALGACLAAIYLRGYLLPGTPRITKRYVPDRLLRRLHRGHARGPFAVEAVAERGLDVESILLDAGALREQDSTEDPCLTGSFRDAWHAEMDAIRTDEACRRRKTALLHDVPADRIEIDSRGGAVVVRADEVLGRWPTESAIIADVAASSVLREHSGRWPDIDRVERSEIVYRLRSFLERCPACGGETVTGTRVVQTCCRSVELHSVTCPGCGATPLERRTDDVR